MSTRKRVSLLATGAILMLVLALGVTAVFAQSDSDEAPPESETPSPEQPGFDTQPGFGGRHGFRGQAGPPEGLTSKDELLAEALDIDVETLEAAREAARAAAIEQALVEGLITEEQAEMLQDNAFGRGFHGGPGFGGFGRSIDHEALLAEALDISVEALQAAQQEAHEAALAEMLAAGYLTEEQVQLMEAQRALKEAIDRDALLAEVLDVSQAEIEEALASREAMAALIEDAGLTMAEFSEAMQAAHEAAVQQAIEDGVITAEQYEALQNAGPAGRGFGGHGRGGHGPGGGGFGGGRGCPGGNGFGQPQADPTGASI